MQQAFAPLTRDRVWLTGLPRNDFITGEQDALPADYRAVLDRVIGGAWHTLIGRNLPQPGEVEFQVDERQRAQVVVRRDVDERADPGALEVGDAADEDQLIDWCLDNLARYKCPSKVIFVETLPRNVSGKLVRRSLDDALRVGAVALDTP